MYFDAALQIMYRHFHFNDFIETLNWNRKIKQAACNFGCCIDSVCSTSKPELSINLNYWNDTHTETDFAFNWPASNGPKCMANKLKIQSFECNFVFINEITSKRAWKITWKLNKHQTFFFLWVWRVICSPQRLSLVCVYSIWSS